MATLSFKNLNKIYSNDVQAVFDFSLEIKDKEFIVFVGPSGCGKSTTLRMVAGLEDITSGELYIDNVLVNSVEPKDRNIAMVFQNYALYPHMTVFNNMAFSLKLRKIPCPVYEEVDEIKALLEENKLLVKKANTLRKKTKKNNEDKDMVKEVSDLYNQIIAKDEEIKKMQEKHHIKGIWTEKINDLEKQIKSIESEINKYQKYLDKGGYSDEITQSLKDGISQREGQLEDLRKQLEYYQTNEVPLFVSRKLTRYEIAIEINKAAKTLDLEKYLLRKPAALSGGQRQRVALGRAIVRHPKVFLMDEPLSNLDAKLRVQTRNEISRIHESVGATTIYVTHDQTEAMTMADRIVVMKDGYIQQIGTPKELYFNPSNIFVAGFIGSPAMNFLSGHIVKNNFVLDDGTSINLNKSQLELLKDYQDKEVVMGIRPESVILDKGKNAIKASCDYKELLGRELIIYTMLSGQKMIIKTTIENEINDHDEINFSFDETAMYFFDKDTTKRIS